MVSAICAKAHRGRVWVEPFCGSAALFYGLAARPERALLNDADPHVMSMHQACRAFSYGEYAKAVSYVDGRFGDVTADKEAYYSFRKWWNEEGASLPEAGLLLIYLSSMCINSMLRFGPNGMNQGWGKRRSVISEGDWEEMRARLQSAELTSGTTGSSASRRAPSSSSTRPMRRPTTACTGTASPSESSWTGSPPRGRPARLPLDLHGRGDRGGGLAPRRGLQEGEAEGDGDDGPEQSEVWAVGH